MRKAAEGPQSAYTPHPLTTKLPKVSSHHSSPQGWFTSQRGHTGYTPGRQRSQQLSSHHPAPKDGSPPARPRWRTGEQSAPSETKYPRTPTMVQRPARPRPPTGEQTGARHSYPRSIESPTTVHHQRGHTVEDRGAKRPQQNPNILAPQRYGSTACEAATVNRRNQSSPQIPSHHTETPWTAHHRRGHGGRPGSKATPANPNILAPQ